MKKRMKIAANRKIINKIIKLKEEIEKLKKRYTPFEIVNILSKRINMSTIFKKYKADDNNFIDVILINDYLENAKSTNTKVIKIKLDLLKDDQSDLL